MNVDKAIALVTAAGIELTDRRRTPDDTGWRLSFSSGAALDVHDGGRLVASGKNTEAMEKALGMPQKAAKAARATRSKAAKR